MPADPLQQVRARVHAGEFGLDSEMQPAIVARIDDVIASMSAAHRALSKVPVPAVPEASAKIAHLFYLTGRGWRRYLAENPAATAAGAAIADAIGSSVAPLLAQLERALDARPVMPVSRRSNAVFGLPCGACGNDAITLSRTSTSPVSPEQLVVGSLSPVTVFRPVAGSRMGDLLKLLEAGDVSAVVKHLRETQPAGCDAYCETCSRVYCRDHCAIEAVWSGSWHESTFVTCPLGHEHEID